MRSRIPPHANIKRHRRDVCIIVALKVRRIENHAVLHDRVVVHVNDVRDRGRERVDASPEGESLEPARHVDVVDGRVHGVDDPPRVVRRRGQIGVVHDDNVRRQETVPEKASQAVADLALGKVAGNDRTQRPPERR